MGVEGWGALPVVISECLCQPAHALLYLPPRVPHGSVGGLQRHRARQVCQCSLVPLQPHVAHTPVLVGGHVLRVQLDDAAVVCLCALVLPQPFEHHSAVVGGLGMRWVELEGTAIISYRLLQPFLQGDRALGASIASRYLSDFRS